jgi:hypothetical protein
VFLWDDVNWFLLANDDVKCLEAVYKLLHIGWSVLEIILYLCEKEIMNLNEKNSCYIIEKVKDKEKSHKLSLNRTISFQILVIQTEYRENDIYIFQRNTALCH